MSIVRIDSKNPQLSQFTKEGIIYHRVGVEGGYVNNSNDLGGATNRGITQATAEEWKSLWAKHGWNGDMRTLPEALAFEIYVKGWWDKLQLDRVVAISPVLADRMFDWGINAGRQRGVFALQRLLNSLNRQGRDYIDIDVDGGVGTQTIDALKAYIARRGKDGLRSLCINHSGMQTAYYVEVSEKRAKNEEFTNGWLTRTADNTIMYTKMIINGTF